MTTKPTPPLPASLDAYPLDERRSPFMELLGVHILAAEGGKARVEVAVEKRHLRSVEMMHGGMTATLLDTAMGMAAYSVCPPGHYSVTIQLDVKYIRPALPGQNLAATGQTVHAGKRTAVVTGEVRTAEGGLIATGTATMMYLPSSP